MSTGCMKRVENIPTEKTVKEREPLNRHEQYLVGNWHYTIKWIVVDHEYTFREDRTMTFDSYEEGVPVKLEGTWECDNDGNIRIYHDDLEYRYRIAESTENKMLLELDYYLNGKKCYVINVIMTRRQ